MELRTYLTALRTNWWIIAIAAFLGLGGGYALYATTPPVYASTVTFYVSSTPAQGTNVQAAGQFAEARVNSYVILMSSQELGKLIVADSGVSLTPRQVGSKISATAELNTVIVTATVQDTSAARSLQIAASLEKTFPTYVDELDNKAGATSIVEVNVTSGATQLTDPVSPRLNLDLGIGLLAGLALGLALALARELMNTSVRTNDEARAIVGAPIIGSIDFDANSKKAPLIVGEESMSVRAESFRQLRTNLKFIDAADTADVLLVTSALPSEGKSTTAANLALVFVELGQSVLLIEGDLRRPKVADYLGLEREVGLSDVLVGEVELDDVIQAWGSDGLSFLASGSIPPNPSELLGSAHMTDLVKEARSRFDKVVIDAPPLLPVTDAAVASSLVDGVVVVVRHGKTHRGQLAAATRSLNAVGARVVGVVMTMRRATRSERRLYGAGEYFGPGSPVAVAGSTRSQRRLRRNSDNEDPDDAATMHDGTAEPTTPELRPEVQPTTETVDTVLRPSPRPRRPRRIVRPTDPAGSAEPADESEAQVPVNGHVRSDDHLGPPPLSGRDVDGRVEDTRQASHP